MSRQGILDADMKTVGGWIAQAARWWLDEMGELVPPALRARFSPSTALVAYYPASGTLEPIDDGSGSSSAPGASVSVVLPVDACLVRVIERPLMSQRDLTSMIALESDRIMPQGTSGMVIASRILDRMPANGRMRVEVAGLPQDRATRLGEALNRAEMNPAHIWVSTPEADQPQPTDLLPALRGAGLVRPASRAAATLWLILAFLFALNLGLLIWRDAAATSALEDMVSQQQPAVDAAHRITARIRADQAIAAATITARRQREPLTILARIDAALPPGTWLQRLSWQGDTIRLTGFRPAKADVSAALRQAGLSVVRYGDTTSTGPSPLGQPFDLTLRLGRR
jgi:general secretion pathway protein L